MANESISRDSHKELRITLGRLPVPAKALVTCIILAMSVAMLGALAQIIVHDIIPTFYADDATGAMDMPANNETTEKVERGDLFSDLSVEPSQPEATPFYKDDKFVWMLKWSHIHLFGMAMIFIFMGGVGYLLDAGAGLRTWLIVLPFFGVLIDIAAVWLKGLVSPAFFWLHLPGGGLFALIFGYVALRALWEMWIKPTPAA